MEVEDSNSVPPPEVRKIEKTAYELLDENRKSMEEIVAKMLFIKKEGRPKSELRELITQMSLHLVNLRQVFTLSFSLILPLIFSLKSSYTSISFRIKKTISLLSI